MREIIDISHHNTLNSEIDFSWIDGAIVRIGYGKHGIDKKYIEHIELMRDKGIPYGIYLYSYAEKMEDVEREFERLIDFALANADVSFIAWDVEEVKTNLTKIVAKGADQALVAREHAIKSVFYSGDNFFRNNFSFSLQEKIRASFDALWIARYNAKAPETFCDMWQHTSQYKLGDIKVDASYCGEMTYQKLFIED